MTAPARTTSWWWLGALTLSGALLRFVRLDYQSLWLDELYSRADGLQTSLQSVLDRTAHDVHPPGYPLIMYFVVHMIGDTEWALRSLSAAAGVTALGIIYLVGRRLGSERLGLTAAALLSVHWYAVSYSQENRPYALLMASTCLLAYLAVRLTQRHRAGEQVGWELAALAICGLAASYLHYFGLLFSACLMGVLGVLALRGAGPRWGWLAVSFAMVLGYLPWLSIMANQAGGRGLPEKRVLALAGKTYLELSARHPFALLGLLVAGGLAWRSLRETEHAQGAALSKGALQALVLWAVLPVACGVLVSYAVAPVYRVRNAIVILPALVLLAAAALTQLDARFCRGRPWLASVAVFALLFDLVVLKAYYQRPTKEPFRQLVTRVLSDTPKEESFAVWSQPAFTSGYFNQYFALLHSPIRVSHPLASGRPAGEPRTLWILARGVEPTPPSDYQLREIERHEPDALNAWPGKRMILARYERTVPTARGGGGPPALR